MLLLSLQHFSRLIPQLLLSYLGKKLVSSVFIFSTLDLKQQFLFFNFYATGDFQSELLLQSVSRAYFFGNYDKHNKKPGNRFLKHASGSWEDFSTQATADLIKIS